MTAKRRFFNGICRAGVYAAALLTVVLLVGILGYVCLLYTSRCV